MASITNPFRHSKRTDQILCREVRSHRGALFQGHWKALLASPGISTVVLPLALPAMVHVLPGAGAETISTML